MNFMDKLKIITDLYNSNQIPRFAKCQLYLHNRYVSEDFIKKLTGRFPQLPISYINFLKEFGDPEIDWFNFYGEFDKGGICLFDILEIWENAKVFEFEKNGCCPIGEDSARDLYCIDKNGQIIVFDSVNVEEPPKLIADSFDEFVGECILGKRYLEFMDEDDFYHFLQEQGWA